MDSQSVASVGNEGPKTIDCGIMEPKNIDHILNSYKYNQQLKNLVHETAKNCKIREILAGLPGPNLTDCLVLLRDYRDALHNLQNVGFCSNHFNMFVEDPARNVANTVRISIEDIETLIFFPSGARQIMCRKRTDSFFN